MGRNIDHLIRSGLRAQVVNNFDLGNVVGLAQAPTFTQRLTSRTLEPYIYFGSLQSLRIDVDKTSTPRDYYTTIEIRESFETGLGGPHTVNQIADEVTRILERIPPVIMGFCVYVQIVEEVQNFTYEIDNKTYFKSIVTVRTRAEQETAANTSGSGGTGTTPVQSPSFVFNGFNFTPTNNRIELHDTGTLVPQSIYPSNNNGFDFVNATYALAPGSDGTMDVQGFSVDADDNVSIVSTLNYENESDGTPASPLVTTTAFPRIKSLRHGAIDGTTISVTDLDTLTADRRTVSYGIISPVSQVASINLMAGERAYVAFDDNEANLTAITQNETGSNLLTSFTLTNLDGFKIYILNNPFVFPGVLNVTLT